jgi:hypothetical protein
VVRSDTSRVQSSIPATAIALSVGVSRADLRWLGSVYRSMTSQSLRGNRQAFGRRSISLASFVPFAEHISTVETVGSIHPKLGSGLSPSASVRWTTPNSSGHDCTNGGEIGYRGSRNMAVYLVSRTVGFPTLPHVLPLSPNPSLNADVPHAGLRPRGGPPVS